MKGYEQMKNSFLAKLTDLIPDLDNGIIHAICTSLDKAAYQFDIAAKETSIVPRGDLIPEIVKIYIAVKKTEGRADGTLENYARTLKQFFIWVKKHPNEVTANDIRMFLYDYQKLRNISNNTLDKYREMICWFFTWAHREEYITKDPGRTVKRIKVEVKERQALTQLELEHLRMICKSSRERAMLEFMYSTGCRVSELCNTKISDIDFKSNCVHLFGKGRKHRTSFINARCEVALREYMRHREGDSEYLFVSHRAPHGKLTKATVEKAFRELSERSGIQKHITPHVFRHTTATQAVSNGMAIEDVSKLLGHANVATTMIYAKVSQEKVHAEHRRCII